MTHHDSTLVADLARILVSTARAHHEATGGVNANWAAWYAGHLTDEVNQLLDTSIDTDELAGWLADADRRYRSDDQTEGWPKAYAAWMVEDFHGGSPTD